MKTANPLPVRTAPPLFDIVMIIAFFEIEYFGLIAHNKIRLQLKGDKRETRGHKG